MGTSTICSSGRWNSSRDLKGNRRTQEEDRLDRRVLGDPVARHRHDLRLHSTELAQFCQSSRFWEISNVLLDSVIASLC